MPISAVNVAKDIFTIASGLKIAAGATIHKIWSALLGAEKKAKAEIAKLEADAAAAVKKL